MIWWGNLFPMSLAMVAKKLDKSSFSVIIAMVAMKKNASTKTWIKKIKFTTQFFQKNWVDWISTIPDKMLQAPRKYTFWEKEPKNLKNITILHHMATFHNFALKIEVGWVAKVVKPILRTRNVNNKC